MITEKDKHIIRRLVEAFPNEIAFQLLCTFRERATPEHYIYAGEVVGASKANNFDTSKYLMNFAN